MKAIAIYSGSFINILPTFLILLYQILPHNLQAQQGIIRYLQVWDLNRQQSGKVSRGVPAYLYFDNNRSLYVYNRFLDTFILESDNSFDRTNIHFKESDQYGNMFYKDHIRHQLVIRQIIMGSPYLSEEPLPDIHWKLSEGKKDIGLFSCKKAETLFRGRYYTAWYTEEIPLTEGPWKLHGLPGLILEAYDRNREIYFIADSIAIPAEVKNDLILPDQGQRLPFHHFKSLEYNLSSRLLDSLNARLPEYGDHQVTLRYTPVEIFDD